MPEDPNTTDISWLKSGLQEVKAGMKDLNEKLDLYLERFETKEHAKTMFDRLERLAETKVSKDEFKDLKEEFHSYTGTLKKISIGVAITVLGTVATVWITTLIQ